MHKHICIRRAIVALLMLLAAVTMSAGEPSAQASPDPAVTFNGTFVSASNITKGGQVVFYALGLVPDGYESFVHRWAKVVTDDHGDGIVRFDAGIPVPCKSMWAVVDLTSGQYTIAAPPGCALRIASLGKKPLKGSATSILTFSHERPFLDFLYVSAGKGAWIGKAEDGDDTDGDGQRDHVTTISLSALKSLTADLSPPKTIGLGGVLVAIDLYRMDIVAVRVDAKLLAGVLP